MKVARITFVMNVKGKPKRFKIGNEVKGLDEKQLKWAEEHNFLTEKTK